MKLKWILTGIVAIVVAAVVAVVAILATMDFEQYRGVIEAEAKKATGRDLALNGPIDLSISLTPAIVVEDVTFANAEWGSRDNMASLDRFEAEVQIMPLLSGDIRINRIVLVNGDILLETDANGTPNWQFDTATEGDGSTDSGSDSGSASSGGQKLPHVDSVAVENSRITYINGATGEQLVLAVDSLTATQNGDKLDLDFAGSYQDAPIELAGSLGSPATLMAGGSYPVDLSGSVAGADLSVSGSIADVATNPAPDLTISVAGENLADFNALAGGGLPELGPYAFSGRVSTEGTTYRVAGMTVSLNDTELSGDLAVDMSGERPRVTASLTSPLLDLGALPGGDGGDDADDTSGGGSAGDDSQYVIPDTPLPLDALKAADADLSIKIDTLRLKENMEISAFDLTMTLQNGRLSIQPLTGVFSGGQMNLALDLDSAPETPTLATAFTLQALDYGALLKNMDLSQDVEGIMDIKLDVNGRGATPHQIASTLNGSSEVISEEGVITNKILAIVSSGLSEVMGPLMGDDKQTKLRCLVSRFEITDGNAESTAMVIDSDTFSVVGTGDIDLATEELDLYFDTKTRQAALVSLAIPFQMKGTMKDPNVVPDPSGALKGVLGAGTNLEGTLGQISSLGGGLLGGGQQSGSSDGGAADTGTSASDNPCVAVASGTAPAAAEEPASPVPAPSQAEELIPGAGDAGKAIEDTVKDAEDTLKKLFGN